MRGLDVGEGAEGLDVDDGVVVARHRDEGDPVDGGVGLVGRDDEAGGGPRVGRAPAGLDLFASEGDDLGRPGVLREDGRGRQDQSSQDTKATIHGGPPFWGMGHHATPRGGGCQSFVGGSPAGLATHGRGPDR